MRILSLVIVLVLAVLPLRMSADTLRGDVDGNGQVNIADVTALIDYLLSGDTSLIVAENADVENNGSIAISDVTCLIDYLLAGSWPADAPHTETFTVNGVSFTMVTVEGGTFMMGATAEQGTTDPWENEYPVHQVTLSTYSIGQTEVTQELWIAVMTCQGDWAEWPYRVNPSHYSSENGYEEDLRRPVESFYYSELQDFLRRLYWITGRQFRLPTEAQWEFAARGGNLSKGYKYSGSDDPEEVAWCRYTIYPEDWLITQPVGMKKPNELGLYDMSGNVWEQCSDEYSNTYSSEPQTDPTGPTPHTGVPTRRGGCVFVNPRYSRVSSRYNSGCPGSDEGFRLAL